MKLLTHENYHSVAADRLYWSVSSWNEFSRCPAAFVARLAGKRVRKPSSAMLVGSAVDIGLLTPDKLKAWISEHEDELFTGGDGKRKPGADYRRAIAMIEAARGSPQFMSTLSGDHQVMVAFDLFGYSWKSMLDVADPESLTLVDLKTTGALDAEDWCGAQRRYRPWYDEYIFQLAVYREAFFARYGQHPQNIALAVVTRQDPPALGIVDLSRQVPRMEQAIRGIESEIKWRTAVRDGSIAAPSISADGKPCCCEWCRTQGVIQLEPEET